LVLNAILCSLNRAAKFLPVCPTYPTHTGLQNVHRSRHPTLTWFTNIRTNQKHRSAQLHTLYTGPLDHCLLWLLL
jgi:hypothetical protein